MESRLTLLLSSAILLALTYAIRFLYDGYKLRCTMAGLPGPPSHPIWGHLLVFREAKQFTPREVSGQNLMLWIKHKYNLPDAFYLSAWPFGPTFLVTCHPDISNQYVVKPSMPKDPMIGRFIIPLGGKNTLVSDDGQLWKTWRAAFNPGFSLTHLLTLMPDIVDNCTQFCELLEKKAKSRELFRLEKMATRLTIDIIGKIVLDDTFNSQVEEHELVSAFESQVQWQLTGDPTKPSEIFDFRRSFVQSWNKRIMNNYVGNLLEKRFATRMERGKSKYLIDLALEEYLKQKGVSSEEVDHLDPEFKKIAIDQVKIFVFAGHDTSSSAICYSLYHLGKDAEMLANVRRELDEVFGENADIGQRLKEEPILLNKLDYLMAVIREALRLYPPANTIREGAKDLFLIDPQTNITYPTESISLISLAIAQHTNPTLWSDPWSFRPSRWLTTSPPPHGAHREAWIPFSKLPRNCIGQELATLEIRMVLAMVCRKMEFRAAYDEVEALRGDGSGYPSDNVGVQRIFGQEAYQIQLGTAKPREGMPGRVVLMGR